MNNLKLSKRDVVRAVVVGNNHRGVFLEIENINLVCRIFDIYLPKGASVTASIIKVFEDYIILSLEAVDYDSVA